MKGCEAERSLWQIQRGAARAKQGETKQRAGFDYVLPMGKSGAKKRSLFGWMGYFRKEISCKIKNCWYNNANHTKAVKERVSGARSSESIRLVKGCGRRW